MAKNDGEKWKKLRAKIDGLKEKHDALQAQYDKAQKENKYFKTSSKAKLLKREMTRLADAILLLQAKIETLDPPAGTVDFTDEENVISVEQKPYDDAMFKNFFAGAVKRWAGNCQTALNTAHSHMIDMKSPDGLKPMDIFKVVGLLVRNHPAAAAFVGVTSTIVELLQKTYNSAGSSKPSINDVHTRFDKAFGQLSGANEAYFNSMFEDFWKDWSKKNNVKDGKVVTDIFAPACEFFDKNYLVPPRQIAKQFLKECVDKVQDDDWFWDELDDTAGIVYITLKEQAGRFAYPEGFIDDVPKQLMEAVRQTWDQEKVIFLPFELRFKIEYMNGPSDKALIVRNSTKPGNKNFKLVEGEKQYYDLFMKEKAYDMLTVKQLKSD